VHGVPHVNGVPELTRDAELVRRSFLYDPALFERYRQAGDGSALGDVEAFLLGTLPQADAGSRFDGNFYAQNYADVGSPHRSIIHFLRRGFYEGRVGSEAELEARRRVVADAFDARHYLLQVEGEPVGSDSLRHYLLHGERRGLEPAADFSPDYYARRYPEIAAAGLSPFAQFVAEGRAQGRKGRPDAFRLLEAGLRPFAPELPTRIVVSPDASLSGAPMVGLMLCAAYAERCNLVALFLDGGPLVEPFRKHAVALLVEGRFDELEAEFFLRDVKKAFGAAAVLANSAMSSVFVTGALHAGIPSVALVHEYASYLVPRGRVATSVEFADRVVVADETLRESSHAETIALREGPSNNITVHTQGVVPRLRRRGGKRGLGAAEILERLGLGERKPAKGGAAGLLERLGRRERGRAKIVLGAGTVELRKGVEYFVDVAAELRRRLGDGVRLMWIGNDVEPENRPYSQWVHRAATARGLDGCLFFFEPQIDYEVFFEVADAFFLPSLLDPFPNVALDAMKAGARIVCFEQATGVADHLRAHPEHGEAVPYLDIPAAADAIVRQFKRGREREDPALFEKQFSFDDYARHVDAALLEAVDLRRRLTAAADRIEAADVFDAAFYDGRARPVAPPARRHAILAYVARTMKSLYGFNPRPGFNQGAFRDGGRFEPADELAELESELPRTTHTCVPLDELPATVARPVRVALHVHLGENGLGRDFAARVRALDAPLDLFVTVTSESVLDEARNAFEEHQGRMTILRVPDRGGDVAPLLTEALDFVRAEAYELVGHVHGGREGERRFLLDHLLGGRENFLRLLGLFERDARLGLVFPEDRRCRGWGANRAIAERLAASLVPVPELAVFPVFPIGRMFWCRPPVLEPLWSRGFAARDFANEPPSGEGTLPRALAAMLPDVCRAQGYRFATVLRQGVGW